MSRNAASLSRSLPKEFKAKVASLSDEISALSSLQSKYVMLSTGKGASAPTAAFDQEAAKNSAFVSMRSAVRERTRSSSRNTTWVFCGIRLRMVSKLSVRSGINDSIPSVMMPSANFPRISRAAGYSSLISPARDLISSVSKSSRHGKMESFPTTGSVVR